MSTGEIRQLPALTSMPQVPSLPRFSPVVELRSEISTFLRPSSSVGGAGEGDRAARRHGDRRAPRTAASSATGWLMVTVGATAVGVDRPVARRAAEVGLADGVGRRGAAAPDALVRQGHVVGPGRVGGADDVGRAAEAC